MSHSEPVVVVSRDGRRGVIGRLARQTSGGKPQILVRFEHGREILVPVDMLSRQEDGSFRLSATVEELEAESLRRTGSDETIVVPVAEERLEVDRRTVETGRVRVRKVVHDREELVDEPLLREAIEVDRVAIGQMVDKPPEVRREGDTLIIPVVEEVLVVEKRLVLKEEIHIKGRQSIARDPQTVALRSEEVIVERLEPRERQVGEGADPPADV